jgi:outer membrane protein assembly factor BamB
MVIVDAGSLAAFDKHTGAVVWKTKAYEAGYGSPVAMLSGARHLIAVLNNKYLLLVDAKDGAEVVWYKWQVSRETSAITPIIHEDTIFISGGYGDGCVLVQFDDGSLYKVYTSREMSNHMNTSVLWEGHLYGFHGNGASRPPARTAKLVCMEHETGSVRWAEYGLGCGSLMIADGKLIVLSDTGELVIIEATPEKQKIISRAQVLDGKCWTMPVLAQGRIYCRNAAGDLVCVDVRR